MSNATPLPNTERLDNYLRQMFNRPLSPRQERRMRKHGRKFETPSNVVELPAGDQLQEEPAETPAMPECEHTNHCPTCGAVDDEPCMTKSKKPAAKPHKAREAA